ncbi:MAG: hypothetical protein RSE41_09025 [Clostridia bacterium]
MAFKKIKEQDLKANEILVELATIVNVPVRSMFNLCNILCKEKAIEKYPISLELKKCESTGELKKLLEKYNIDISYGEFDKM